MDGDMSRTAATFARSDATPAEILCPIKVISWWMAAFASFNLMFFNLPYICSEGHSSRRNCPFLPHLDWLTLNYNDVVCDTDHCLQPAQRLNVDKNLLRFIRDGVRRGEGTYVMLHPSALRLAKASKTATTRTINVKVVENKSVQSNNVCVLCKLPFQPLWGTRSQRLCPQIQLLRKTEAKRSLSSLRQSPAPHPCLHSFWASMWKWLYSKGIYVFSILTKAR